MTTSRSSGSRRARLRPDRSAPPLERAKAVALRLLAAQARTEAQVRTRLEREALGDQSGPVVAWLRGLGYLDDDAYAGARARSLTAPGRLGPRAAERRLLADGVEGSAARGAVAAALAEAPGGEAERCLVLARKRAGGQPLAGLDDRARARLARFLLGRGFSGAAVARTLGGFEDRDLEEP
jgi:regulatory protein